MKWRDLSNSYQGRIEALQSQLASDPYAVLGIEFTASDEEIRLAYRKKVRAYHPDRQGEFLRSHAQEVIKIVNAAYERICRLRGI